MRATWRLATVVAACVSSACASGGGAPDWSGLLGAVPDAPAREVPQSIWEAVLTRYRHSGTSGDVVRFLRLIFRQGGHGGRAPTVLLLQRDSALPGFNHDWVLGLIHRRLIDGVCVAARPTDCPQHEVTTYLRLGEPEFEHEGLWKIQIFEVAVGPSICAGAARTSDVADARLWLSFWVTRTGTTYESVDSRIDARAGPTC